MSNNTSLINKTRVKRLILTHANELHDVNELPDTYVGGDGTRWDWSGAKKARVKGKFTQVSQNLLEEIDREVRKLVYTRVANTKQTGKTVK